MGGAQLGADARDAGQIHERMLASAEEIQRPRYTVDTSQDMEAILAAIAKEMMGRG